MRSAKGQFIVEGMIAMGIIVSSVLGIFSLAISALRTSSVVTDQFIAANLAAEGLEVTKNILDSNVVREDSWNENFSDNDCIEVFYESMHSESDLRHLLTCDGPSENDIDLTFGEARFLRINGEGLYDYNEAGETTATIFKRWIQIRPLSDLKIRAIATVAWYDPRHPAEIRSSKIATDFIGWRAEQ